MDQVQLKLKVSPRAASPSLARPTRPLPPGQKAKEGIIIIYIVAGGPAPAPRGPAPYADRTRDVVRDELEISCKFCW